MGGWGRGSVWAGGGARSCLRQRRRRACKRATAHAGCMPNTPSSPDACPHHLHTHACTLHRPLPAPGDVVPRVGRVCQQHVVIWQSARRRRARVKVLALVAHARKAERAEVALHGAGAKVWVVNLQAAPVLAEGRCYRVEDGRHVSVRLRRGFCVVVGVDGEGVGYVCRRGRARFEEVGVGRDVCGALLLGHLLPARLERRVEAGVRRVEAVAEGVAAAAGDGGRSSGERGRGRRGGRHGGRRGCLLAQLQ